MSCRGSGHERGPSVARHPWHPPVGGNLEQLFENPTIPEKPLLLGGPQVLNQDAILYYMDHPDEYVLDVFGKELDDWQSAAIRAIFKDHYVSIRSGNGVGKTWLLAIVIAIFLTLRFQVKVICVSPTKEQMNDSLWSELYELIESTPFLKGILVWTKNRVYSKFNPEGCFAVLRAPRIRKRKDMNAPKTIEALQGRHSETVVFIGDEAAGLDEAVLATMNALLTTEDCYSLLASNATTSSGYFYETHHSKADLWTKFHVNAEESPRVSKAWIARQLADYGSREHPLYRIRVRGEFPLAQPNALFPYDDIQRAMDLEILPEYGERYILGCDIARYGGNATVIAIRRGPVIERFVRFQHFSLMETTGRIVKLIQELDPISVRIDAIGIGAGVYDRLNELGIRCVIPIVSGSKSSQPEKFMNLRAEMNWNLRMLIQSGTFRLPKDDKFVAEASPITYKVLSSGKIQIESKDDLLERGFASPDHVDAAVMTCTDPEQYVPRVQHRAYFGTIAFMGR